MLGASWTAPDRFLALQPEPEDPDGVEEVDEPSHVVKVAGVEVRSVQGGRRQHSVRDTVELSVAKASTRAWVSGPL